MYYCWRGNLFYWNPSCYGSCNVSRVNTSSINFNNCRRRVEVATRGFARYAVQIHAEMVSPWNTETCILRYIQPIYSNLQGIFGEMTLVAASTGRVSSWLFTEYAEFPYLCLLMLGMLLENLLICVCLGTATGWRLNGVLCRLRRSSSISWRRVVVHAPLKNLFYLTRSENLLVE